VSEIHLRFTHVEGGHEKETSSRSALSASRSVSLTACLKETARWCMTFLTSNATSGVIVVRIVGVLASPVLMS